MRNIRAASQARFFADISAGDKKSVRVGQQCAIRVTELRRCLNRRLHGGVAARYECRRTALNILCAVAEALHDLEHDRIALYRRHDTIDAIAPARLRLQTEATDHHAGLPAAAQWITR
jgi:hypothetical protein